MLSLILRRLLFAIPMMFVIIGIVFVLYQYIPGDPVEAAYTLPETRHNKADSLYYQLQYDIFAKELGLDKPLFFCGFDKNGNFHWNGLDNQYFNKVKAIFRGDFGRSYRSKSPVLSEISDAIRWTLTINFIALLLIFFKGIALGLIAAAKPNSKLDKRLLKLSFITDSFPPIWIVTMAMIYLTSNYYGLPIFPTIGLGNAPYSASFLVKFLYALPHLILPVLLIVITSYSLVFRQMRSSAMDIIQQDYIRTAKAKGLNDKHLMWRHIFPNAIFPIITLLGLSFPGLIVGSIVIESVFNIPGMGKLTLESISTKDFPILFALVLLTALLTIIGNIIADVLYFIFEPKMK